MGSIPSTELLMRTSFSDSLEKNPAQRAPRSCRFTVTAQLQALLAGQVLRMSALSARNRTESTRSINVLMIGCLGTSWKNAVLEGDQSHRCPTGNTLLISELTIGFYITSLINVLLVGHLLVNARSVPAINRVITGTVLGNPMESTPLTRSVTTSCYNASFPTVVHPVGRSRADPVGGVPMSVCGIQPTTPSRRGNTATTITTMDVNLVASVLLLAWKRTVGVPPVLLTTPS